MICGVYWVLPIHLYCLDDWAPGQQAGPHWGVCLTGAATSAQCKQGLGRSGSCAGKWFPTEKNAIKSGSIQWSDCCWCCAQTLWLGVDSVGQCEDGKILCRSCFLGQVHRAPEDGKIKSGMGQSLWLEHFMGMNVKCQLTSSEVTGFWLIPRFMMLIGWWNVLLFFLLRGTVPQLLSCAWSCSALFTKMWLTWLLTSVVCLALFLTVLCYARDCSLYCAWCCSKATFVTGKVTPFATPFRSAHTAMS